MLFGGGAGCVAALITNPIDTLTTRLQAQGSTRRFGTGMVGVLRNMFGQGAMAFWRGSVARMGYYSPLSAVQFTMYERAMRAMDVE